MEKYTPEQEADFHDAIIKNERGEIHNLETEKTDFREALIAEVNKQKPIEQMFPDNEIIEQANVNVGTALFKGIQVLRSKEAELAEIEHILKEYYDVTMDELDKEFVDKEGSLTEEEKIDFQNMKEDIIARKKEIEQIRNDLHKLKQIEES